VTPHLLSQGSWAPAPLLQKSGKNLLSQGEGRGIGEKKRVREEKNF